MDLFFYFTLISLFIFICLSYYFFSRVIIVRLLQQESYFFIICICSLFFTFLFMGLQYIYLLCEPFFFIEPLWFGKILFLGACISALFFIIQLVLPLVPHAVATIYLQKTIIITNLPGVTFDHCIQVLKLIHGEILLQSPESLFLISQFCMQDVKKEQSYIVEIRIEPCIWKKSQVHFLCYPSVRGSFIEKKDLQKIIEFISKPLSSFKN